MTKATIYYHDIGDYLTREQKLEIIRKYRSINNIEWQQLTPNEHGDWISQRNDAFGNFIPLEPEKKFDAKAQSFFLAQSMGVITSRDAWIYNFSKDYLIENIKRCIDFYNEQVNGFVKAKTDNINLSVEEFIEWDKKKFSWDRAQKQRDLPKGTKYNYDATSINLSLFRPYSIQQMYFNRDLNNCVYQIPQIYPNKTLNNLVICISGIGSSKEFSVLITDKIPDYQLLFNGQSFPLYYYEESNLQQRDIFNSNENKYTRRDAVSDFILKRAQEQYGKNVSKEDIFYFVYGFLHSPKYRETFAADLKKMLPRLPLVEAVRDFWAFSKAGRHLAELHLNYESVESYQSVRVIDDNKLVAPKEPPQYSMAADIKVRYITKSDLEHYRVEKMRFPKGQNAKDKPDTIIYNSHISIENIPAKAYEYIVNGKSAIEWIMERYAITTHKESGITNNPNDWAEEQGNPKYILELLLSVINVSVQTVEIVQGLPKVEF